jgi:hypothetical protein
MRFNGFGALPDRRKAFKFNLQVKFKGFHFECRIPLELPTHWRLVSDECRIGSRGRRSAKLIESPDWAESGPMQMTASRQTDPQLGHSL